MSAKPALGAQRPGVPQRHPAIVGERQRHTLGLHPARLPGPERLHRALQRHLSPRSARRQPVPLTGRGPRRHRGMAGDKTSTHPRCHRSSAAAGVQKTMAATAVSRKDWTRLRGLTTPGGTGEADHALRNAWRTRSSGIRSDRPVRLPLSSQT